MKTRYSKQEYLELINKSLSEYLDKNICSGYTSDYHIEDLLINTAAFFDATISLVSNTPNS